MPIKIGILFCFFNLGTFIPSAHFKQIICLVKTLYIMVIVMLGRLVIFFAILLGSFSYQDESS